MKLTLFVMLILRQSQGDSIERPKERNCTLEENRNNFRAKKYEFITILTYEFVLTMIYILKMTWYF